MDKTDSEKLSLKDQLLGIQITNYQIPASASAFEMALAMMERIGDPDPVLRDELIYSTLRHWILQGVFVAGQLRQMLSACLDDQHLFYRVGEEQTDSVFTRSFSVLMIPLIMHADRQAPFLDESDIQMASRKLLSYLRQEMDLRGYTGDTGWAHAVAHAADAVEDVVQSKFIQREELAGFLEAFQALLIQTRYAFIHEEDERMVTAFVAILNRNLLLEEDISRWILELGDMPREGRTSEDFVLIMNVKNFLRSLYFRILPDERHNPYTETIRQALNGRLFHD
ncbi:DUF2785 domain-containing protein [Paenibacillus macerans]|uniref:DUF2785 domain-containing protein n=1 Tax=Paenibacillus macerans TaxID=44252 RepID=UPI003D310469